MGWLVGYTLASIAAAFVVMKLFDYIFAGVTGGLVSSVRAGLFIATWTAVTVGMGMQGFTKKVRQVRQALTARILR